MRDAKEEKTIKYLNVNMTKLMKMKISTTGLDNTVRNRLSNITSK